jgi:hypothetical protein
LLDAPAVNETLAASRSELTLIVSAYMYDSVLRHAGERVDLDAYRPVDVTLKETWARAWIQAPATTASATALPGAAAPDSFAHLRAVGQ